MKTTRRRFVAEVFELVAVAAALVVAAPKAAFACLGGTWYLYCGNQYENAICGQIDRVTAGTCQHVCSRCNQQVFRGSYVTVVCPNGHHNRIATDRTTSHKCPTCNEDCQREKTSREKPDKGGR